MHPFRTVEGSEAEGEDLCSQACRSTRPSPFFLNVFVFKSYDVPLSGIVPPSGNIMRLVVARGLMLYINQAS